MTPSQQEQERAYRELMGEDATERQKRERATKCKSCGAPIIWARTANGRNMPLDFDQSDDGNVFFFPKDKSCYIGSVTDRTPSDAQRHKSHFATCPNASMHRGQGTLA